MSIVATVLIALLAVYIGNVVGVSVICDTMPSLKKAKRFAPWIPFLGIGFLFHIIFEKEIENKRQFMAEYLITPHKNVVFTIAVAEAYEEVKSKNRYQSSEKVERAVFRGGMSELGKRISCSVMY